MCVVRMVHSVYGAWCMSYGKTLQSRRKVIIVLSVTVGQMWVKSDLLSQVVTIASSTRLLFRQLRNKICLAFFVCLELGGP